jgi:hypothetical protein
MEVFLTEYAAQIEPRFVKLGDLVAAVKKVAAPFVIDAEKWVVPIGRSKAVSVSAVTAADVGADHVKTGSMWKLTFSRLDKDPNPLVLFTVWGQVFHGRGNFQRFLKAWDTAAPNMTLVDVDTLVGQVKLPIGSTLLTEEEWVAKAVTMALPGAQSYAQEQEAFLAESVGVVTPLVPRRVFPDTPTAPTEVATETAMAPEGPEGTGNGGAEEAAPVEVTPSAKPSWFSWYKRAHTE